MLSSAQSPDYSRSHPNERVCVEREMGHSSGGRGGQVKQNVSPVECATSTWPTIRSIALYLSGCNTTATTKPDDEASLVHTDHLIPLFSAHQPPSPRFVSSVLPAIFLTPHSCLLKTVPGAKASRSVPPDMYPILWVCSYFVWWNAPTRTETYFAIHC
jgi:hypothetical protein